MGTTLLLNTAFLILAAFGCLIIGALMINEAPLFEPPGFANRLRTYLTTNVAETRRNHEFPELELRCYKVTPQALFPRLERAIDVLGWQLVDDAPEQYRLKAVVETQLLKFKDDIDIQLRLADCGTELHIRASSRVGRGDLAANTRHIMALHNVLASQT